MFLAEWECRALEVVLGCLRFDFLPLALRGTEEWAEVSWFPAWILIWFWSRGITNCLFDCLFEPVPLAQWRWFVWCFIGCASPLQLCPLLAVVDASLRSVVDVGNLASLCAGVNALLNNSEVYKALLDEWAEPILVSGPAPPSDSSESVSVSSLNVCYKISKRNINWTLNHDENEHALALLYESILVLRNSSFLQGLSFCASFKIDLNF